MLHARQSYGYHYDLHLLYQTRHGQPRRSRVLVDSWLSTLHGLQLASPLAIQARHGDEAVW